MVRFVRHHHLVKYLRMHAGTTTLRRGAGEVGAGSGGEGGEGGRTRIVVLVLALRLG